MATVHDITTDGPSSSLPSQVMFFIIAFNHGCIHY